MGYNDETTRDELYDVPSDVEALRSEAEALKKQQEASTSAEDLKKQQKAEAEAEAAAEKDRVNNLITKRFMSIEEAIKNSIKIGDRVIVRTKFNIFSKGVEGKLEYINLISGSDPPKATMSISCFDDICKKSEDRFDSSNRNIKSFDDNYKVKVSSSSGGKSNRKSKKSNKKSKKSNKKSKKSNRKSNKRYNKKSKKINF